MSTTAWMLVLLVVAALGVVGVLIAYSRGKGLSAQKVTQYDQQAAAQLQQQMVAAQAELDRITAEAGRRRTELEAALVIPDEAQRLRALADLYNRWKG